MSSLAKGSPEWYTKDLYSEVIEISELNEFVGKQMCRMILRRLMYSADETMKFYYRECLHHLDKTQGK